MPSATQQHHSGLKAFIATRASNLCNHIVDSSALALIAADEVMWRYLEASHNPYAKLLHKGLTAGPKKSSHTGIDTTTAEAFEELQVGLSVVEDEELENRLISIEHGADDAEDEIEMGRFGGFLASTSVAAAIGVDEAIRRLAATRLGGVIGLPKLATSDASACNDWNELHHELSCLPQDDETEVMPVASSSSTSRVVALARPITSVAASLRALPTLVVKKVVMAVPISDPMLAVIATVADRLPALRPTVSAATKISLRGPTEAEAWEELHSNFSY